MYISLINFTASNFFKMNKISCCFLVLIFVATFGSTTECCILPELVPVTKDQERIIKNLKPRTEVLVEGSIFTVSYNEVLQQPNWIRYDVRSIEKLVDRYGMVFYEVDTIITSDNEDYYSNPWDKGHLAPAAAFTDSYDNLYATFSFLNCTLQKDQLNRGEWAELETQIREWADQLGTLNIEIVLEFNETATTLPTGATIPVGYWKNIQFPDDTKRCFYFPNEDTTANWTEYEISCNG